MGSNTVQSGRGHQPERKHRRFSLRYPVCLKFTSHDSSQELHAISENVSVGGMLLVARSSIPKSASVTFTLTLQKEQTVCPIQLSGEGTVVRVESASGEGKFIIAVQCVSPISVGGRASVIPIA
jgi:hypothetical protein